MRDAGDHAVGPGAGRRSSARSTPSRSSRRSRAPGKVVCVGRNYAEHAAETGSAVPTEPQLFAKWANAVVGPGVDVDAPADHAARSTTRPSWSR